MQNRTTSTQGLELPVGLRRPVWRLALAGFCASFVGLGLARFAYTPLIPALIAAGWFAPANVVYLGAANLTGYLLGALIARPLAKRIGAIVTIRGAMVVAALSCLACATPVSFAWFFAWRLASGISGALVMVLAASSILPMVPVARRGIVGGMIFAGVGLGVAASGTLVPLLLRQGLFQSWIGLAVLGAVATATSWTSWADEASPALTPHATARPSLQPAARALLAEYGLTAFALVPHMVFLVDFVARGRGQGVAAGAAYWVVYGLGATVGPLLTGHLADRAGFGPAMRLSHLVIGAAAVLPAASASPWVLIPSCLVVGGFTTGVVPLALGRIHELVPHGAAAQQAAWARATTTFALGQAIGAYGLSYLFQLDGGRYAMLFLLSGAAMAAALGLNLAVALSVRRPLREVTR